MAAGPLARDHGIIMVGTPKTIVAQGDYGRHRVIDSGEGFVEVDINGEKAVILTVPYPSEKGSTKSSMMPWMKKRND